MKPFTLGILLLVALSPALCAVATDTVHAAGDCYGCDGEDMRFYVAPVRPSVGVGQTTSDPFEKTRQAEAREYRNQHPLNT